MARLQSAPALFTLTRKDEPMRLFKITCLLLLIGTTALADTLPSWHEGQVKTAIITWLDHITDPGSPDFIPPTDRIAVFDNDGTSWCERPGYGSTDFQVALARSLAAAGRIDAEAMPFKAWFADDHGALRKFGYGEAYRVMNAAFAGMPVTAYRDSVRAWLNRTRHPRFGVPLTDLYYTGMMELKDLLIANGFQVWIVTGAAQDFVRSYSEDVLNIPPGQVIGSWTQPVYQVSNGKGELVRGEQQNYNGHENKPASIETRIGKRPVFAAGNSNNDEPMVRWTVTGPHHALGLWIHHDDRKREYDYDRGTDKIAGLAQGNPAVLAVSIKNDWARIFVGAVK